MKEALAASLDLPLRQVDEVLGIYVNGFGTDPRKVVQLIPTDLSTDAQIVDLGSGFGQVARAIAGSAAAQDTGY